MRGAVVGGGALWSQGHAREVRVSHPVNAARWKEVRCTRSIDEMMSVKTFTLAIPLLAVMRVLPMQKHTRDTKKQRNARDARELEGATEHDATQPIYRKTAPVLTVYSAHPCRLP